MEFKLVERPEGHLEYEPRPTPDALAAYYRDKYFGADHGQTPYAHGYTAEELASIPAEANMGLSCGNPTALASLRAGEGVSGPVGSGHARHR